VARGGVADFGDGDAVAEQDFISHIGIGDEVKCNYREGAADADAGLAEGAVREEFDDFAVDEVHGGYFLKCSSLILFILFLLSNRSLAWV